MEELRRETIPEGVLCWTQEDKRDGAGRVLFAINKRFTLDGRSIDDKVGKALVYEYLLF